MKKYDPDETNRKIEQKLEDATKGWLLSHEDQTEKYFMLYMKMMSVTNELMNNWISMQKDICKRLDKIEEKQEELFKKIDK